MTAHGAERRKDEERHTNSVIMVLVDGLRPEAISPSSSPNLSRLLERSSYTMRARSVMPCVTLPCHMSLFHSVPPERHGVTTNDWQPMARPLPGLVEQAHAAGRKCALFYNWEPLRNLSQPGSLSFSYFRDNVRTDSDGDRVVAEEAARYILQEHPDFTFVYLGTVDIAGHNHGWMSAGYLAQVLRVDTAIGRLMDSLRDEMTVLVLSDHGGHDRTHGSAITEDMTIPWMASGPAVHSAFEISRPVSLLDTAPTVARLLGIDEHAEWEGHCVEEIFG